MRKFLLAAASTVLATGYSPAVTSRAFASGARGVSRSAVSNQCMSATLSKPSLSVVSAEPATHPAFELVRVDMVDEYTIKAATYRHKKSGAEIISAQADDDNKVFGVVFRTPVKDSTGVPHVLEHSVLCGSDKYTSKEPFVELLKGSLQTFLNAFTYPDRTCYPVASQNTKDFYNLVNVYLDAVLHPRAKRDPTVLAQEGWHYELEDAAEPLTFKGVVFNEMKGVYSSPESRLYRASQQTTFPDNTYAVDSGGDPEVIPNLSFEQFKSFHDAYYHPANGRFFFYGDDAPLARLELLDEYLQAFDAKDVSPTETAVATQKLYAEPWKHVEAFPAGEGEDAEKHMVMVNWLLHEDDLSDFDQLALGVLDHLLMGTTTAPLYQAMLSSGLGTNVMGGGLSDELKQATFSVGLKGVEPDNVAKVEELALTTLQGVAARGFGADEVEASMNTIEFQLRECNTGGFPKGLSFMLAIMPRWIYSDKPPMEALAFEASLAELKSKLAAGERVFEGLLERMLLKNGHRNCVELKPDKEMGTEITQREEEALGRREGGDVRRADRRRHRRDRRPQGGAAQGGQRRRPRDDPVGRVGRSPPRGGDDPVGGDDDGGRRLAPHPRRAERRRRVRRRVARPREGADVGAPAALALHAPVGRDGHLRARRGGPPAQDWREARAASPRRRSRSSAPATARSPTRST